MIEWPHQTQALVDLLSTIAHGERRIVLTSPTGGGKTRIMLALAKHYLERGQKCVLYSNRKMLVDQTSSVLALAGMDHGIRAAGYQDERERNFQVSSIQTEHSRVMKNKTWNDLHEADLVIVDEGHLQNGESARAIFQAHYEAGAVIVFFTATPIGMSSVADCLITAGTTSALRTCGALVPAFHYAPDEPDLRKLKNLREGEDLSENQQRQAMMTPTLWGRLWYWFEKINPEHKPFIVFGPDVRSSIWIAEQFTKKGVRTAHIDGQDVWLDGRLERSSRTLRQEVLDASRTGDVAVITNRFVLREGLDLPWLAHGILATVFGSVQSYLQSGGRLLRAFPGKDRVTIQDHGGSWWRHGSLNADRQWKLNCTASMIYGFRADRIRARKEPEPFRCPQCGLVVSRAVCPCGYMPQGKRSRPVVTTDGQLIEMTGDIFRPRRISQKPNGPELWERMYWRSQRRLITRKDGKEVFVGHPRTFRQAFALFASENNWGYPDRRWPLMPLNPEDEFRLVAEVAKERLTQ